MNKLTFKKIDFWLQITTFFSIYIFLIVDFNASKSYSNYGTAIIFSSLIPSYFIIGFVQLISIISNLYKFKTMRNDQRKLYEKTVLILFILTIFAFSFLPFGLIYAIFMIFVSPVLAIWYLIITWTELKEMKKTKKN